MNTQTFPVAFAMLSSSTKYDKKMEICVAIVFQVEIVRAAYRGIPPTRHNRMTVYA